MDFTKKDNVEHRLARLESYCSSKDYAGFCKFDALNSPLLEKLFGGHYFTRLLVTQVVNRIPLPLRSLFGVPARRNPKGIANFVRAYADLYRLTGQKPYLDKTIILADWLLRNESHELNAYQGPGKAWGYHFPWQSPGFFAPRHSPNLIVTTFVGEAMLSAFEVTGKRKYLDAAFGVRDFLLRGLPTLLENDSELCIGYVPKGLRWRVININAVGAGFLARLAVRTADRELAQKARKMIQWVIGRRNLDFTWDYTSPKDQSGIGPDNYHTGGILDGIYDFMTYTGDDQHAGIYKNALEVYRTRFFEENGAPKWRLNKRYPCDIHGSAQGVMTFSRAASLDIKYFEVATRISDWAARNLYDEKKGRFYYQKRRFFTWKIDLMRWNNSWMMRAMTEAALAERRISSPLTKRSPSVRSAESALSV